MNLTNLTFNLPTVKCFSEDEGALANLMADHPYVIRLHTNLWIEAEGIPSDKASFSDILVRCTFTNPSDPEDVQNSIVSATKDNLRYEKSWPCDRVHITGLDIIIESVLPLPERLSHLIEHTGQYAKFTPEESEKITTIFENATCEADLIPAIAIREDKAKREEEFIEELERVREEGNIPTTEDLNDAIVSGNHKEVQRLLSLGASPLGYPNEKVIPLHLAAYKSDKPKIVRTLAKESPNIDFFEPDGYTPLLMAVKGNPNLPVIKALLDEGANPNATTRDKFSLTALHIAVVNNRGVQVIKTLLNGGVVPQRSAVGALPSVWAEFHGSPKNIVRVLKEAEKNAGF